MWMWFGIGGFLYLVLAFTLGFMVASFRINAPGRAVLQTEPTPAFRSMGRGISDPEVATHCSRQCLSFRPRGSARRHELRRM